MTELARLAQILVAPAQGILAIDESPATLTKRFDALRIESTALSRRDFRELLLSTPGLGEFISGAILNEETLGQLSSEGEAFPDLCARHGFLAGIKVDKGARHLAGHDGELVTEGLDDLRERLASYRGIGARFAKWRAIFCIDNGQPSRACISANASALSRYAALCQEQGLVPIVEPEVVMNGRHTIDRCEEVTTRVLHAVFAALAEQDVVLEEMLLKPNMIVAGDQSPRQPSVEVVAQTTLRVLRRVVPPAVPGIAFLSGGQDDVLATEHLEAINRLDGPKPWRLTYSYGRGLQDDALARWRGRAENVVAAQRELYERARANSAACLGKHTSTEVAPVRWWH